LDVDTPNDSRKYMSTLGGTRTQKQLLTKQIGTGVHGTQFEREPRMALEIHASRIPIERYESEHSAGYLEHGDTISEGIVLEPSGKTSAQFEDLLSRHVCRW
jgi:hypothetical protein